DEPRRAPDRREHDHEPFAGEQEQTGDVARPNEIEEQVHREQREQDGDTRARAEVADPLAHQWTSRLCAATFSGADGGRAAPGFEQAMKYAARAASSSWRVTPG